MRLVATTVLVAAMMLTGATSTFAQIAADPLVPTGNLNLAVGTYSPLPADSARAYASYSQASGTTSFRSGRSFDYMGSGFGFGADFSSKDQLVPYFGYSANTTVLTANPSPMSPNLTSKANTDSNSILFGASSHLAGSMFLDARAAAVNQKSTLHAGLGGGEATLSYLDLALGLSFDAVEKLRLGFGFSPKVSKSSDYSGVYSGNTAKGGHGTLFQGSIAYNEKAYTLSADVYSGAENDASDTAAIQGLILQGKYLFGKVLVSAQYDLYQESALSYQDKGATQYITPPIAGANTTLSASWVVESWVLTALYEQSTATGSDFGNASADSTRFDHYSLQFLGASVLKQF